MKKVVLLISLILTSTWTQSCDKKFPGHTKPPAINHSNPDNQPTITTCRKDRNDQFNLCKCFDKSGAEVMEDKKNTATLFCCQCPETLDEAYSEFKDIVLGSRNKFSFDFAEEIEIQRCPKIAITSMPMVEKLSVQNSKELNFPSIFSLPKLKMLNIVGQSKPSKYDQDVGTFVTMAEVVIGSRGANTELIMKNTKISKFPKQLILKTLEIDTSLFSDLEEKTFPDISSTAIQEIKITNSDILSLFQLGLSSYEKPFTFSKNKIYSTCQTKTDKQKCFLQFHKDLKYSSNKIMCLCSDQDGAECESKDKAITKFECPDQILKNTICSDLQEDKSLEYLKKNNIGDSCSQFEYDLEVLKLNINREEDPNIPFSSTSLIWLPIVLGIVAIGVIIVAIFFLIKMKNMKPQRKKSLYKLQKEDLADEGELVEDD